MTKSCRQCGTSFEITSDDLKFLEKLSPVIGGKKYLISEPTFCPDCRQQRRITFRNDQNYYKNSCHLCHKSLISIYSPDKKIPVLCEECFWGDQWDPLDYGQDFDFSRPFFEQFAEMKAKVPRLAIFNTQSENSEYTVHSSRNKNCYIGSSLVDDEDVHYSDFTFESKDSIDLFSCEKVELCYQSLYCGDCYNSDYLELCYGVSDSYLSFDCKASQNLIGCVAIRNRHDLILNQPCSRDEYQQTLKQLKNDPAFREAFQKKFEALKLEYPKRDAWIVNSENCTGNYITHSKSVSRGYNVKNIEDARYIYECHEIADAVDIMRVAPGEVLYEVTAGVDLKYSAFCNLVYQSDNMLYSDNCQGSKNCFGGMGLKKHQYCILNKQYSKEDYEKLVLKIIEYMKQTREWGEFFPVALSPFGYNETKAMDWYPLEKEEVLKRGWKWSDYEQPLPQGLQTISASDLPHDIRDVADDILNAAIVCEVTGKPFRIVAQELAFYRKKGLPLPKRSPKQRHRERMTHQNFRTLYNRTCDNCGKPIQTTYAPERPEKVFCEECYLKEVY